MIAPRDFTRNLYAGQEETCRTGCGTTVLGTGFAIINKVASFPQRGGKCAGMQSSNGLKTSPGIIVFLGY